jgi:hypothetical protein
VDQDFPGFALAGEDAAPLGGEAAEAAPPLAGFLHPSSLKLIDFVPDQSRNYRTVCPRIAAVVA